MSVANFAERLARQETGKIGLVFSLVTAVALGAVLYKTMVDLHHERDECRSRSR